MKRFMMHLAIATMMGGVLASCGRDEDLPQVIEPKKEEIVPLKAFTLEKTEITVKRGTTEKIRITSGNGEYMAGLSNLIQPVPAIVRISSDNQYVEVVGLIESAISTLITDVKSGKRIKITINITK